jgi:Cap4 SAVED domain
MVNIMFDTLIDDSLAQITNVAELASLLNKRVLSLANDFEDGKWRYNRFQNYLWDNIAQTALSERERLALADQSHSSLVAAAQNLRLTDKDEVGQGSEIAEVFLYGVMRNHYKALPVVPKIFYKQNAQDNAKGADSVHIVVDTDSSDFTLWFGEAKFYNSIADARLDAVVSSVYASLDSGKLKKENSIITNVSDIDQLIMAEPLRDKIKAALSSQVSIDYLKSKINIPILILHQCAETAACTELSEAYRKAIIAHHTERAEAYFTKQISKSSTVHRYSDVRFHIILFPVPDKKVIVDAFLGAVSFYKSAA